MWQLVDFETKEKCQKDSLNVFYCSKLKHLLGQIFYKFDDIRHQFLDYLRMLKIKRFCPKLFKLIYITFNVEIVYNV